MQTLTTAGAEKYYNQDNYYLESQGYWHGELAENLNLGDLNGTIQEAEFKNMLRGFDPMGNALLETAGKTNKKGEPRHRPGIDLTFSAPKSVSILSYQDKRIQEAFDNALHATLNFTEQNFTQIRRKKDAKSSEFEKSNNMAVAVFNHRTSRELDPQLHAHCVVMNLTRSTDGTMMSMDNAKLYENKMLLGQYFRNELALEMKKIGYQIEVTDQKKGFFEVKGVSNDIINDFSKRREQVQEELKRLRELKIKDLSEKKIRELAEEQLMLVRHLPDYQKRLENKINALKESDTPVYAGVGDAELASYATTGSRIPKKNVTEEFIINQMNQSLETRGENLENLTKTAQNQDAPSKTPSKTEEIIKASIDTLTKTEVIFTKERLLRESLKLALGNYTEKNIDDEFQKLMESGDIVHLRDEYTRTGSTAMFSTKELKNIENENIDIFKTSKTDIKVDESTAVEFIENQNNIIQTNYVLSLDDAKFNKVIEELPINDKKTLLDAQQQHKSDKDSINVEELFKNESIKKAIQDFCLKQGRGFTEGQKDALKQMVSTENQFSVIQGDAGTGKSFSMMYAKDLMQAQGYTVRGLAPTGKATDELKSAAKLDNTMTLHLFVLKWYNEQFRKKFKKNKECFIVDEAGMIGSRMANSFMKIAQSIGAKVVFVGDRKQFASVEAGKFFSDLQDKTGVDYAIMENVMRQKTEQTKGVVKALSDGAKALSDQDTKKATQEFNKAFNNLRGYTENTQIKKSNAKNYEIGQILIINPNISPDNPLKGLPTNTNLKIVGKTKSRLNVEYKYTGANGTTETKTATINPKMAHNYYTVYSQDSQYQNCIQEITDEDKRLSATAEDYLECYKEKKDAIVITGTNDDRIKLNNIIRQELVNSNLLTDVGEFTTHEPKSVSDPSKAENYQIGQIIEISPETSGEITAIDRNTNTITYKTADGRELEYEPIKNIKEPPSVYQKVNLKLAVNEKVAFLKNAVVTDIDGNDTNIRNGQLATIVALDKNGDVMARIGEGSDAQHVRFNLAEYGYLTTAYAISLHKSQGMTVDKIIWHANTTKNISMNSAYVAITRCKSEISIYTDNLELLQKKAQKQEEKGSTYDENDDEPEDKIELEPEFETMLNTKPAQKQEINFSETINNDKNNIKNKTISEAGFESIINENLKQKQDSDFNDITEKDFLSIIDIDYKKNREKEWKKEENINEISFKEPETVDTFYEEKPDKTDTDAGFNN